jgi:FKBP-type peptidyl-prolyl cis-trans isomerase FkpA
MPWLFATIAVVPVSENVMPAPVLARLYLVLALTCFTSVLHSEEPDAPASPPTKLTVIDGTAGTGRVPQTDAYVILRYTGWLYDPSAPENKGHQFASSEARGESLTFLYGFKRVMPGLERGIADMKVGGKRTIIVPPKLAYDGYKYPYPNDVPPGSALIWEVELMDVVPRSAPPDQ